MGLHRPSVITTPERQPRPDRFLPAPTRNLFIDLVPGKAWFSNLRSELLEPEWDAVRRKVYRAAGYHCRICGEQGPNHPVEAHERWHFDEARRIQTLVCVTALCPMCHEATHYGLARVLGRDHIADERLMRVNGWSKAQLQAHINEAMATGRRQADMEWRLDARWLLDFVELSEQTRLKILALATGVVARPSTDWRAIEEARVFAE